MVTTPGGPGLGFAARENDGNSGGLLNTAASSSGGTQTSVGIISEKF